MLAKREGNALVERNDYLVVRTRDEFGMQTLMGAVIKLYAAGSGTFLGMTQVGAGLFRSAAQVFS